MTAAATAKTLHALLSAGGWKDVEIDGLEVRADGRLELLGVPALAEPSLAAPGGAQPSGLALDAACGLYLSDGERPALIRVALDCAEWTVLSEENSPPGARRLERPAGICVGPHGWLFVADRARASIVVFTTPDLAWRDEWSGGLDEPVAVAPDRDRGVYVLDAGPGLVLRFDPFGGPDTAFIDRMKSPSGPAKPRAIASDEEGTLYVADEATQSVLRFDSTGSPAGESLARGRTVQAIAVARGRLFAADEQTGRVVVVAVSDGRALGEVAGFGGPVTAIAAARDGTIYIKPGAGEEYLTAADRSHVALGSLETTTPLDAGEEGGWTRAVVDADAVAGTSVNLETFAAATDDATVEWVTAAASDAMLADQRFLWLRVTVERDEHAPANATPVLAEVRAEAAAETYLDYLPAVYSRNGERGSLLSRLLALAQATLGDRELEIDDLPRRFDAEMARPDQLGGLAAWQAFDVPRRLAAADGAPELRSLLAELPGLYARRGTPWGVRRFCEIYAGVRPTLLEHFRARGIWMIDGTAALGLDTVLPGAGAGGIVVDVSNVGSSGPEDADEWGSMLFEETAHRFTAIAPAATVDEEGRRALERVLDAEKPAHTQYHLCLAEPRLRVGMQANLGLDAIVAGAAEGLRLDERGRLDLDARSAEMPEDEPGAVGSRGSLGVDTTVG